eukprot:UN06567
MNTMNDSTNLQQCQISTNTTFNMDNLTTENINQDNNKQHPLSRNY